MYCAKCGKQTNGSETVCEDCKAAEAAAAVKPVDYDPNKPNVSMLSFGKALASIIMGFGVFIVSNVLNTSASYMNIVAMIFLILIDVTAIVLAIVFGSKAIRTYGAFRAGADKKPTAAFVMGIIGVVLAGIATVILLVFMFVELPIIVAPESIPLY